jgi:hypothetical protein
MQEIRGGARDAVIAVAVDARRLRPAWAPSIQEDTAPRQHAASRCYSADVAGPAAGMIEQFAKLVETLDPPVAT